LSIAFAAFVCCAWLFSLPVLAQPLADTADSKPSLVQKLNATLVQTATLIQSQEQDALNSEARLGELRLRRRGLSASFDRRSGELSELLAALERVGRQPPALMLARPESAVEQVRGAMLLGSVIKTVEEKAAKLREDLAAVSELEEIIRQENERITQLLGELKNQKEHLAGLLEEKNTRFEAMEGDATQASEAVVRLAERAKDIHELLDQLEEHSTTIVPREKPVPVIAEPEKQGQTAALAPVAPVPEEAVDVQPDLPSFGKARGQLPLPARGKIVAHFGRPNGAGGSRRGISIRTLTSAEVIAPFDGKVVFAGPFRDYGQLLILEAGGGYHILLSGMSRVSGVVGQSVAAGEPVGRMGGETDAAAGKEKPGKNSDLRDLYVEFRKDGEPFNPLPWLVVSEKKVSG